MKVLIALIPLFLFANPFTYSYLPEEEFSIHMLEIDPAAAELSLIDCNGFEKPSAVANRLGAIAAINGGFYHASGEPSGIFKMNGTQLAETDRARGAIGWDPIMIDRLTSDEESGNLLPLFHAENGEIWNEVPNILGTTPVLLTDGTIPDFNEELLRIDFLEERFPRSAIGIKQNGHLLFVLVEEPGMTIAELAGFMLSQDCSDAINLCGGNSSSFYFNGQSIHAKPSEEKEVKNVIIVKERLCQ